MTIESQEPGTDPAPSSVSPPGIWQKYHGVVAMAIVITITDLIHRTGFKSTSPTSYFTLAVAYTSASGGWVPGIAAAVLGLAEVLIDASVTNWPFHYDAPGKARIVGNIIAFFGTALIVGLLKLRNDTLASENVTRAVEARTREVEAEATRKNELKLARVAETLQRSLLLTPPKDLLPGVKLATFYASAWDEAEVGGDFYDAFALQNGWVALVVGDVTGKGLVAAARTAEVKYVLRAYLREDPSSAAKAIARLNRFLCTGSEFTQREMEKEYICLSLALLNPLTGDVQIVAAGSEPPLFVRSNGAITVEPTIDNNDATTRSCPMLGVDADVSYSAIEKTLGRTDALLLLTDGLTEARSPADRVFFADGPFYTELIRTVGSLGSEDDGDGALSALTESARAFAGGGLRDDVCMLLVRLT